MFGCKGMQMKDEKDWEPIMTTCGSTLKEAMIDNPCYLTTSKYHRLHSLKISRKSRCYGCNKWDCSHQDYPAHHRLNPEK